MATYVQISREMLEAWLDTINRKWKREEGTAGVYLLPVNDTVAVRLSSTIGTRDDAMGRGRASMQLALCSLKLKGRKGQKILNRKAQGKSHFKRTTNWKTNWAAGIKIFEEEYRKKKDWYDTTAVVADQDSYRAQILKDIEEVNGWEANSKLQYWHGRISRGSLPTLKDRDEILAAISRGVKTPEVDREEEERTPEPQPTKPVVDEVLLQRVRQLWVAGKNSGNSWLMGFAKNVGNRIKDGKPLSGPQEAALQKNLKRHRLATDQDMVDRIARKFLLAGVQ